MKFFSGGKKKMVLHMVSRLQLLPYLKNERSSTLCDG